MPSQFPGKIWLPSLNLLLSLFVAEHDVIWHEIPFWLIQVICLGGGGGVPNLLRTP